MGGGTASQRQPDHRLATSSVTSLDAPSTAATPLLVDPIDFSRPFDRLRSEWKSCIKLLGRLGFLLRVYNMPVC